MSIEKLLEQLRSLDEKQQQEFLSGIQDLIDARYIDKSKVAELQKEMNLLLKENNLVRQQALVKFSRKEHQTIAYQLGKNLIDVFNGKKGISSIPVWAAQLFVESIARKDPSNLNPFQKKVYILSEYGDVLTAPNLKTGLALAFEKVAHQLKGDVRQGVEVEGEYQDINNKKALGIAQPQANVKKQSTEDQASVVLQQQKIIKQVIQKELKETVKASMDTLKIACIMDEFTYFCFSPEAQLLQISPENWLDEVTEFAPDILFIESAWQGKDGLWKSKVSQNSAEVINLIKFCKLNGIKTMFWNKEDPVHFGTFVDVAKQVDVVFTTDIDCIGRYKAHVGHDQVYLMPFAAQPKTHNPIEKYERKDAFNFAGSFYLKYPERQRDFVNLIAVATKFRDLEIYDRNFNNPHPHYTFPEQYQKYILGRLEPHEIDKAYKGYVYGINMNTIKQSQSMFARRVFEMLASNTIVLSNYSRGVRNFFGDLVLCSDNPTELERQLNRIVHDQNLVAKFKLLGLRKVLSEHTYEDRLGYIANKLKIKVTNKENCVAVFAVAENDEQLKAIIDNFVAQTYEHKKLFIYNPNSLEIETSSEVHSFNHLNQIDVLIQEHEITHLTFFNPAHLYTKDYLFDMMLNFRYLKYTDIQCVTKDAHYTFDHKLSLISGKEYLEVQHVVLDRSVLKIVDPDVSLLIESFVDNVNGRQPIPAMAVDRFSFIVGGKACDAEVIKHVMVDIQDLDTGVELKQNLLPYAENISAMNPNEGEVQSFEVDYLAKTVVSPYTAIRVDCSENHFKVHSKLAKDEYKYLTLLKHIKKISENISLLVNADTKADVQFAIEFYDVKANKIGFEMFEINRMYQVQLPFNTKHFNVSLRMKGSGSVNLQEVIYSIHPQTKKQVNDSGLVTLDAEVFKNQLVKGSSSQIQFAGNQGQLVIKTTLPPAKHAYMYMKKVYTREELNLVLNSEFELFAKTTAEDVRIVFEFQDANHQKISHSMNPILGGHALAIPIECVYVRIGLKIVGAGETVVQKLSLGTFKNPINNFIPKSRTLIVAKQYPSYDDLYKYGFLHTRLRAYKQSGSLVDMFKVTTMPNETGFSEFEGIDVFAHDHEMLDKLLASGAYDKVCIHLIDKKIWDVVKKYQDKVQIIIWVHGAEIQVWQRREFEFENMSEQEIVRQKKLSDQRRHFWRTLVLNELEPSTQFIFVSQYFLNESEEDLGVKFPKEQCHIVHNYIDTNFFNYVEKPAEQRFKLLSIRPFASRKYANDLTVKAIEELSKRPNFEKFEIAIYGDGKLFDEITAPLTKFKNVQLYKKFLNHAEIAQLHKEYGVFIVPTRMDSQGVSRDEAMASGLVPVTTAVTAIPEFVDNNCGILVEGEDYKSMAENIYMLSVDVNKFKKMSLAASKRVNSQSSFDHTIGKELILLN